MNTTNPIDVIIVDESGNAIGAMEKLAAHQQAVLHRAITVYVFNSNNELLLQQRAMEKYHCGGLWSNTCCGHPLPGETTVDAAGRRLYEEMGIHTPLQEQFTFRYRLPVTDDLVENEFGHIYFGYTDQLPQPDATEVMNFRYINISRLKTEMEASPNNFTPWFHLVLPEILKHLP